MDKKSLDKDVLASLCMLLVGIFFAVASLNVKRKGMFILSPGMFPFLCAIVLILLALIYLIRSLKRGGHVSGFGKIFADIVRLSENRQILLAIAMVAFFVFVGIRYISYYITAVVFLFIIGFVFVKRFKWWHTVIYALAVPGIIYLIFNKIFSIRLM
jgi:hypothetical protein